VEKGDPGSMTVAQDAQQKGKRTCTGSFLHRKEGEGLKEIGEKKESYFVYGQAVISEAVWGSLWKENWICTRMTGALDSRKSSKEERSQEDMGHIGKRGRGLTAEGRSVTGRGFIYM